MNTPARPPVRIRRRPVVMTLGGALCGLGLALVLVHFARIALGTDAPAVVVALGAAFGLALAYALPPRAPRPRRRGR